MSGLVNIDQELLATAAPKFTRAMTCFISSAAALRQNLARVEQQVAARGTPATARDTRQMDRLPRDAENADERVGAVGVQRRAVLRAHGRTEGMALNLVDVAIVHPRMKEKAEALKAAIEKAAGVDHRGYAVGCATVRFGFLTRTSIE